MTPLRIHAETLVASDSQDWLWSDPRVMWGIAICAVLMLMGTWFLARRKKGRMNRAAVVCAVISIALHGLLIYLLPMARQPGGGSEIGDRNEAGTVSTIEMATYVLDDLTQSATADAIAENTAATPPLPIQQLSLPPVVDPVVAEQDSEVQPLQISDIAVPELESLVENPLSHDLVASSSSTLDALLSELLTPLPSMEEASPESSAVATDANNANNAVAISAGVESVGESGISPVTSAGGGAGRVIGDVPRDYANRRGTARRQALLNTGGDDQTEAAVHAGIAWLSQLQRADGAWDPEQSGAGIERSVLGQHRNGAGAKATAGISGLALLSMLGAGNTHQEGMHQDSVRAGLQYLLTVQGADGSLAADADHYARTYSHGMASLAMCETAAMSADPVAKQSAASAVRFTIQSQHPSTGGWRYLPGDKGDLSQLGWQAMVLVSGKASGVVVPASTLDRTRLFLRSVRGGKTGGLASYKPGEAPSRTMTAEALAIRLLLGEQVPAVEIAEAEAYLLEELPGTGPDNFYYWYYASLALHQLQDDAWRKWNPRMKERLLATQLPDGSWSTATVWGGHGGKVYTTAMACLCLEVYYRHVSQQANGEIATRVQSNFIQR